MIKVGDFIEHRKNYYIVTDYIYSDCMRNLADNTYYLFDLKYKLFCTKRIKKPKVIIRPKFNKAIIAKDGRKFNIIHFHNGCEVLQTKDGNWHVQEKPFKLYKQDKIFNITRRKL
jgi:hypothetical protein